MLVLQGMKKCQQANTVPFEGVIVPANYLSTTTTSGTDHEAVVFVSHSARRDEQHNEQVNIYMSKWNGVLSDLTYILRIYSDIIVPLNTLLQNVFKLRQTRQVSGVPENIL